MTNVRRRIWGGSRSAGDRLYMIIGDAIDPAGSTIATQGQPEKIRPDFQKTMTMAEGIADRQTRDKMK